MHEERWVSFVVVRDKLDAQFIYLESAITQIIRPPATIELHVEGDIAVPELSLQKSKTAIQEPTNETDLNQRLPHGGAYCGDGHFPLG